MPAIRTAGNPPIDTGAMTMSYVFDPPAPPSVAMAGGGGRFPVRRIFCVGRNYAAHAREMGKDPDREPPFFFTKPADAVVDSGRIVPYPPETSDFQYEIELVVAIGRQGFDVGTQPDKVKDLLADVDADHRKG